MATPAEAPIPSVKDLASSEPTLRRNSLNAILTHLKDRPSTSPLSATQSLQLWRGFYISLYMHDTKSAISVQNLATTLASTFSLIATKEDTSWLETWSTAFWETMAREWSGIDSHRLNKFLMLIRFVVREVFGICLDPDTDAAVVQSQIEVLGRWPLAPRERKVPDGLRLHVLDVWVDELDDQVGKIVGEEETEDVAEKVEARAKEFMKPVQVISRESLSRAVKIRAKEALQGFEERETTQNDDE